MTQLLNILFGIGIGAIATMVLGVWLLGTRKRRRGSL